MLKINALDTLFFRDGKPFTMGQETEAAVVFPPYPSVVHGALRTAAYFSHHNDFQGGDLMDQVTRDLYINQSFLEYLDGADTHYLFPLPLDFFVNKSDKSTTGRLGHLERNPLSSNPLEYLVVPRDMGESASRMFFKSGELLKYINGRLPELRPKLLSDLYTIEEKIGNGRNDQTFSVEEGLLYALQMIRPKVNLLVETQNALPITDLLTRLGGEGKFAEVKNTDVQLNFPAPSIDIGAQWLKLYLATPAIFPKNGWQPDFSLVPKAACVGKYLPIGGFDPKSNVPKAMLRAVPAGSVYYYYGSSEQLKPILAKHGQSVCEPPYDAQGFGIAYCAALGNDQLNALK